MTRKEDAPENPRFPGASQSRQVLGQYAESIQVFLVWRRGSSTPHSRLCFFPRRRECVPPARTRNTMLGKTPDSDKEKSNKSSSLTITALQALTPLGAIAHALRIYP